MSRRGVSGVLFDLDGTLLDTARDMAEALNRLRESEGLERLPFERIRPLVSHGAPRMIRYAFDEPEGDRYESLRRRFLDLYAGSIAVHTRLFAGF
jgi:phosphoglycolate phosphatase-like HAD superfamily hydrolase